MPESHSPQPATSPQPSFEEALDELDRLVASMEEDKLPLEELVARFEKGTRLLHRCQQELNAAEWKIEKLKAEGDQLQLDALDLPDTPPSS